MCGNYVEFAFYLDNLGRLNIYYIWRGFGCSHTAKVCPVNPHVYKLRNLEGQEYVGI